MPADLPSTLETDWRLVPMRWVGIVLMVPVLQIIHLDSLHLFAAYGLLAAATVFNATVGNLLRRRPDLLTSGYVTTLGDGLLNVGMICVGGGFESPFYFILYTVTVATSTRYGYKPTGLVTASFITSDVVISALNGGSLGGSFIVRSAFLALTGMIGSQLREQARRARSELEEQWRRAERESLHDGLTGLGNRTLLVHELDNAIADARQQRGALALLVLDLDRFKEVNDTLGHHFGDMLLVQVATRLRRELPENSIVARLGGDEFAVLMRTAGAFEARAAASAVHQVVEPRFQIEEHDLDIRASVGIALYPDHAEDATSLLRHADVAMYAAKRSGDGYTVYDPRVDMHSPERLALVAELRDAVERRELALRFQPKVSLATGELVGVEALARWRRANGVNVNPAEFIAMAEQTGLIRLLTRRVLEEALRQCAAWRNLGFDIPVAVNVSMRDLQDPDLAVVVEQLLARWGVAPANLLLEITESALMDDPVRTLETADRVAASGVRLAIDDFGTGYSSLVYLKRLPITELKIDRSFVSSMSIDQDDSTIVRSTIGLAHDLGLAVVAEGVEDQETWDCLARLGCDIAQGYHISQPLAPSDLVDWIGSRREHHPRLRAAA